MRDNKKHQNPNVQSDNSQDSGDYDFVKEIIKNRPIDKKVLVHRIASIIAGAVLFGVVAAITFTTANARFTANMERQVEQEPVDIQVAEPTESPAGGEVSETAEAGDSGNVTLEDYENIFNQVHAVAEDSLRSMVTVMGVAETDALDDSYVSFGQSTGVIIALNNSEIYVLTQKTALGQDSDKVQVTFSDEKVAEGTLKKADDRTGLAVVSVSLESISQDTREEIQVANLGSSYSLMEGKPVIAIGSPSGYNETVTYGNIISVSSKVTMVDAEYNILVTDIQGSQEGSGVLLDTEGNVIGIIIQSIGNSTDTMVKALSVSQLKSLLAILSNEEEIKFVGICGQDVSEAMSKSTGIPQGVYVDTVETESPAMVAGVQSGDVLISFGDKEMKTMQDFSMALQECKENEKVTMKVMRSGNEGYAEMEFEITVTVK